MPWYGLAGWPGWLMLGEWSRRDGEPISIGLLHGEGEFTDDDTARVEVFVGSEPPEEVIRQRILAASMVPDPGEEVVMEAMRQVEAGPTGTVSVAVDGQVVLFDHWVREQIWVAAREHDGYTLAVEARQIGPDELDIVRVHDIEPYLVGRRATVRRMRGEA